MRIEEFENKTLALQAQIDEIKKQQGHLIFLDESVFTARGFQMKAWSN